MKNIFHTGSWLLGQVNEKQYELWKRKPNFDIILTYTDIKNYRYLFIHGPINTGARDSSSLDKTKKYFTLELQYIGLENEKTNLGRYSPNLSNLHIQEILQQFMAGSKKQVGKKFFPVFHLG